MGFLQRPRSGSMLHSCFYKHCFPAANVFQCFFFLFLYRETFHCEQKQNIMLIKGSIFNLFEVLTSVVKVTL